MSHPTLLKPTAVCPRTWRPILWREWQKSQKSIIGIVILFVVLFMVMPFDQNGWMLMLATLTAGQYLAVTLGGSDIAEGAERYAFVLPIRQADYFWARYAAGMLILTSLVGVAFVMNAADLHRYFWGLFCESGLSDTRVQSYPEIPIGNFILCGLFAFSNSYCVAVSTRRPTLLAGSWFLGLMMTYAAPAILLSIIAGIKDVSPESHLKSSVFVMLSAVISAIVLSYLSRGYVGKSSAADVGKSGSSNASWHVVVMVVVGYIILSFVLSLFS